MASSPSVGPGTPGVDASLSADRVNLETVARGETTANAAGTSTATPVTVAVPAAAQTSSPTATTAAPAQSDQPSPATANAAEEVATPAATPEQSTISVDTGNGVNTPVQVANSGSTGTPITGAAGASSDPATNAAAQKMLASVDAELATRLGSKYKAPTNHKERTQLVAQVASSLKGAEKTAFLNKMGELGKDFGLNFGQSGIKASSANLSTAQKEIQAALYQESQTGKAYTKAAAAAATPATPAAAPAAAAAAKTPDDATVATQPQTNLPWQVRDFLATTKLETREQTRERFQSMDRSARNGRLSDVEWVTHSAMPVEVGNYFSNVKNMSNLTVDEITDKVRQLAGASAG